MGGYYLPARYVQWHGLSAGVIPGAAEHEDGITLLDWTSSRRNALRDLSELRFPTSTPFPPLLDDLLDIVSTVYLGDIATPRYPHSEGVRALQFDIPVRVPGFWVANRDELIHLLYVLTHDNNELCFHPHQCPEVAAAATAVASVDADCVCLLSGGLASFAGGASLLSSGRKPMFVSHRPGHSAVELAQRNVLSALTPLAHGQLRSAAVRLLPHRGSNSLPFPYPEAGEQRHLTSPLLHMGLGATAAYATGVLDVYLFGAGTLADDIAHCGTHMLAIRLFNKLLERMGLTCRITNPLAYQTKGEAIRRYLKPFVPADRILDSYSCQDASAPQSCGVCTSCLSRRVALLSSGLPDDTWAADLLATPEQHRGSDGFGNLVGMLMRTSDFLGCNDWDLLYAYPKLLDLDAAEESAENLTRALRRHAAEVQYVLGDHFPTAAALLGPR